MFEHSILDCRLMITVANRQLVKDIANHMDQNDYLYEMIGTSPGFVHFVFNSLADRSEIFYLFSERIAYYASARIRAFELKIKRKSRMA